jgi:hypothetical protein
MTLSVCDALNGGTENLPTLELCTDENECQEYDLQTSLDSGATRTAYFGISFFKEKQKDGLDFDRKVLTHCFFVKMVVLKFN